MPYSLYSTKNPKKGYIDNLAKPTIADPIKANIQGTFGTASPSATSPVASSPAKADYISSLAKSSPQPIAGANPNIDFQTFTGNAPQGTPLPTTKTSSTQTPENNGYKDAFKSYIESLMPSNEETAAQERLNQITTKNRLDYEKALGQGETLNYATGLAGEQARTAAIQEAGAAGTLSALTGRRQAISEAEKARLDYEKSIMPNTPEPFTLGEGQVRYGPNGEIIAQGAPKSPNLPASAEEYQYAVSQGYKGSFNDYQNEDANRKRSIAAAGSGAVTTGAPTSYKEWELAGGQAGTGKTYNQFLADSNVKAPTVAQQTVGTYATRIEQANPSIESASAAISGMNPVVFEAQQKLPSYLQSATYQKFDQAARNFINAVLRRESGAVISPSEFDNAYKQYLPRAGDTKATLAEKKKNRDIVYQSFKKAAGSAYESVDDLLDIGGGGTSGGNNPLGI